MVDDTPSVENTNIPANTVKRSAFTQPSLSLQEPVALSSSGLSGARQTATTQGIPAGTQEVANTLKAAVETNDIATIEAIANLDVHVLSAA